MNSVERAPFPETEAAGSEPTAGEILIAARQAQNLSVTDVANRLKLSVPQVEALEQGTYERLPGPVFVRGFTRNYARLLKLDAEAVMRALDASLPRGAAERPASTGETNIPMPVKSTGRWPVLAGIAAVVFLGAALVEVLWPEAQTTTAVTPAQSPQPVEAQAATAASTGDPSVAQAAAVAPVPALAPPATPAGGAVPATYQPAGEGAGRVLRLAFDEPSWVQVRDSGGKVVLEALFPRGSSREITAQPPLTLIIGNAPAVRLTYGERAVDLAPHTRVSVARLTLE